MSDWWPEDFHFLRPWALVLLIPALGLWWAAAHAPARSVRAWRRVCDPGLLAHLLLPVETSTRRRLAALLLAWWVATLALAGPAWRRLPVPLFERSDALVVALDLSRSMLVDDLPPARYQRARFEIIDLLDRRQGGQVGLVAFAGDAFAVAPLTRDDATLEALLGALSPDLMPVQGSRTDLALKRAADLLARGSPTGDGHIVLVTDSAGLATEVMARQLVARGIHTSVLAVGTAEGRPIPSPGGGFVKDQTGAIVVAGLDIPALSRVAAAGRGRLVVLSPDDRDTDALLAATEREATNLEQVQRDTERWRDEGPWLLLLLLPLGAMAFRRGQGGD
ncbi:MAG: VWA domain-containing protein [Candidatus Competibacterales bacterium]